MQKWLILDRDGVINEDSDHFIKNPDEWHAIAGSISAIARLNAAAYRIVIISNQSGIARGLLSLETLESIHQKLNHELTQHGARIEKIYFCPHGPDDACACRKPLAGLFQHFADDYQVDLSKVIAVGDSIRDLQAAHTAGASSALLKTGKGLRSLQTIEALATDDPLKHVPVFENLADFAEELLNQNSN